MSVRPVPASPSPVATVPTTRPLPAFRAEGFPMTPIAILVTLLTVWPWFDRSPRGATGLWFAKTRRLQNVTFLAIVAVIVVFTLIGTFCRGPYWQFYWPWQTWPDIPARL